MSSTKTTKEELKKEEYKKQQELKLKKQKRKELLTVLTILSSVFVNALLIAVLKGGERMVRDFTGGSLAEAREIYENTRNALIGIGIISLIIMLVFIVQCVKERNKNKRAKQNKKAFIDYDRLEMARVRVAKAHQDAKKQGAKAAVNDNNRYRRLDELEREDKEYLDNAKYKKYHGLSEEEYRRIRKEEYDRYMRMDFTDDEERDAFADWASYEEMEEYEEYTRTERIKLFIKEHIFVISIVAGVGALAIMSAIIIGMLL